MTAQKLLFLPENNPDRKQQRAYSRQYHSQQYPFQHFFLPMHEISECKINPFF